jgi:inner membrane protein
LAAEAADIDILWGLAGPVEELKHHRGITHTLIAVPVVAAVSVGLVWLFDRWREARRNRNANENAKAPPAHWGWLYLTALLSALSHLLLDWTNNYGLRPFFPFNPRWYAGSLVFIAEPVLWALLLVALLIPALLSLIGGEIGAKKNQFRGQGWAIFALSGMVLLWGWRWAEQGRARALADNTQIADAAVKRMALEPYPVNPFRWHAILETADYYQTAEIDTLTGEIVSDRRRDVLYKPIATAAVEAAKRTPMGQVYLDWGAWAVVRDVGPVPIPGLAPPQLVALSGAMKSMRANSEQLAPPQVANRQWTTVEFDDLRWDYSYLGAGLGAGRTPLRHPLAGWVYIVDSRDEAGEMMNGRVQR